MKIQGMIRSYVEGFGLSPNLIWKLLEGLLNTLCDLGQERCFGLGFSKTPGGQGSGVCGPSPGESLWSTQCCRIWVGRAQMAKEQDPVNLILTKLIIKISIFLKYAANTLWGANKYSTVLFLLTNTELEQTSEQALWSSMESTKLNFWYCCRVLITNWAAVLQKPALPSSLYGRVRFILSQGA